MLVSVFMDVEDPVNPAADDAALDMARLFADMGVRASFCVTGDKCRALAHRGRQDVAAALSHHCLGLHTNGHSKHPTTMELLEKVPFEEGCELAYAEESKGYQAFKALFGRPPAFWGGAGNTWSPEITDALKRLGIPAYSYAHTSVPGDTLHRFNGVLALPQTVSVSEQEWATQGEDAGAEAMAKLEASDLPWAAVFVGHPTRFRHERFWDEPYARGRSPLEPEPSQAVPEEVYQTALKNLGRFLGQLRDKHRIVGVDDLVSMDWRFRLPMDDEIEYFRQETAQRLKDAAGWVIHRPGLDTSLIAAKTLALAPTLEILCPD
jgi:hypothetical protein